MNIFYKLGVEGSCQIKYRYSQAPVILATQEAEIRRIVVKMLFRKNRARGVA
jgi:hypothetical protein